MVTYEFILRFNTQDCVDDIDDIVEALAEAGCTDALVGIGQTGRIAMMFGREADTAVNAISSAISDVKTAIPDARLIEASPDLVGLSDTAELLGFSRQNMRKLMISNQDSFPAPVHDGKQGLWHLDSLLFWLARQKQYDIDESLIQLARANRSLNLANANYDSDQKQIKVFTTLLAGG